MLNSKKRSSAASTQNVKVVVRIRPLNPQELDDHVKPILKTHTHKDLFLKEKKYTFDRVFKSSASQPALYNNVIAPLIPDVVEGYNCTVFTYGQTGTGKTYTMTGDKCNLQNNWKQDPDAGIIPRAAFHIFDELNNRANYNTTNVTISYIELYNEEIRDLLSDDQGFNVLQVFSDVKGNVTIPGLKEFTVDSGEEACKLLQKGILKRQMAPTLMNHQSSRSHTVFTITVNTQESTDSGDDIIKTGKIKLVDLAGNENIARSGCKDMRATELANINRSLLTLGRVIHSLADKSQKHVPYRDSKLTRILQDSLGGCTKTVIIATVSPAHAYYEITQSTLDYATRARDITNTPLINEKLTKHQIIEELTSEIERLQKDLDAARSGTGFYVDKENYQRVLDAVMAITGEPLTLSEMANRKVERIKSLEVVLQSKIKHFEETVIQCKRHKEELETAKAHLKEKDNLIEQEMYLSKWYEDQTMQKLEEAQHLLQTTKQLNSEKEILLAKLENMFALNTTNDTVIKQAVVKANNMCDKLEKGESARIGLMQKKCNLIKDDLLSLPKTVQNSTDSLKANSKSCDTKIRERKKILLSGVQQSFDAIRNSAVISGTVIADYDRHLNEFNNSICQLADNCKNTTKSFLDETMTELKRTKASHDDILYSWEKDMLTSIQEDENHIITLKKRREEDKNHLATIMKRLEEDENQIITFRKRIEKNKILLNNIKKPKDTFLNMEINVNMSYAKSAKVLDNSIGLPDLIESHKNNVQNFLTTVKEFDSKLSDLASFIDDECETLTKYSMNELTESILDSCNDMQNDLEDKVKNLINDISLIIDSTNVQSESFKKFAMGIKQTLQEQIMDKSIKPRHEGNTPMRNSTSVPLKIKDVTPRDALLAKFKEIVKDQLEKNDVEIDDDSSSSASSDF
ncbi:unnamed protein product [Phyllotreta striolata]|uniref:Kinesin-like protein n=1 Tax=Phyllotreta striolata TaxID=444603 RepID=A0A9N9TGX5_PHYSR|nr:unnamed protein product [Phyllotreta striolata]